jgi:hypothetical protein
MIILFVYNHIVSYEIAQKLESISKHSFNICNENLLGEYDLKKHIENDHTKYISSEEWERNVGNSSGIP